jgi:SAM-dependent methyltransferase
MFWIGYTTRYRGGGQKFARAANTLGGELRRAHPQAEIRVTQVDRKADFVEEMRRIAAPGQRLDELHFLGHSGMYGPMFGSTAWPEQLSPHEWRSLGIPFDEGASAHFHACRTARWFAPFFARTFAVRTFGHQGYTSVSTRPDRFVCEPFTRRAETPLYLVSVPGRKTHGLLGSLRKYLFRPLVIPMTAFDPAPARGAGYDAVADLYDRAFADIRVRPDEWRWLCQGVERARQAGGRAPRVLDIGCGNGALLAALEGRIASSAGVDVSRTLIDHATRRAAGSPELCFRTIEGPTLPFPSGSFDVVISCLSFRYLDWDPMLSEIRRILAPGGRLLVVDMVEAAITLRDTPLCVRSAVSHLQRRLRDPVFTRNLRALTGDTAWKCMLGYNPIRAAHEYRWYFESRFPGRKLETLNVGRRARLVAFDSGSFGAEPVAPLSYP